MHSVLITLSIFLRFIANHFIQLKILDSQKLSYKYKLIIFIVKSTILSDTF